MKERIKHPEYWMGIFLSMSSGALIGWIQRGELSLYALFVAIPSGLTGFLLTVIKEYKPKTKSDESKRGN
jgi:hypothetical protein